MRIETYVYEKRGEVLVGLGECQTNALQGVCNCSAKISKNESLSLLVYPFF